MSSQLSFNPNGFSTYLMAMLEIGSRSDKSAYIKLFESELLADETQMLADVISPDDVQATLICQPTQVSEPSQASVAICFGPIGDMGNEKGVRMVLQSVGELVFFFFTFFSMRLTGNLFSLLIYKILI
jgi:hypothetical protein